MSEGRKEQEIDRQIAVASAEMQVLHWSVLVNKQLGQKAKLSIFLVNLWTRTEVSDWKNEVMIEAVDREHAGGTDLPGGLGMPWDSPAVLEERVGDRKVLVSLSFN